MAEILPKGGCGEAPSYHCCIDRLVASAYTQRAKPEETFAERIKSALESWLQARPEWRGDHSMTRGMVKAFLATAAVLILLPAAAYAQEGQIAGTVKDTSGALMPGVTVEVSSPALIEKVRTAETDASGAYRITNLPVGAYKVVFSLSGFTKQERDAINLTSG